MASDKMALGDGQVASGRDFHYYVKFLPFGNTLDRYLTSTTAYLDKRIPTIRGRPALTELLVNLKPGITVSLVSLPLSISLAIAADATPVQGIITAAWAGIVSAFTGGSHYNIVGPTGALSGLLSEYSVRYGPGIQPLLAIMAGLISLLVYFWRLERFFVFIPGAVMHGFTLGVAFIISLNQLNFALGLPKLVRHEKFLDNLVESLKNSYQANWFAILFFIGSYGALYVLQKKNGKVPWSIFLAMFGIFIGFVQDFMNWQTTLATIKSRYGELEMTLVDFPDMFSQGLDADFGVWVHLFQGALSIAVVAVLETLISAHIADRMTKTLFNQRQEVLAVSLANVASGLAGGIPATAALARTALNVKSGATSRASGIINGIFVVLLSTVLFGLFKFLPLPVVAAILVNVAVRMVEWHEVKLLYKMDKPMFAVALLSAFICIVEDPTLGIIFGAFFAMIRVLLQIRHAHAILRLYKATKCRLNYLFEGSEVHKSVKTCRSKYTAETAKEIQPAAAIATVVSSGRKLTKAERRAARKAASKESGRRNSAANEDLFFLENDVRDAAVPEVAVYMLPGYYTFVSAQAHRDRIRALFTETDKTFDSVKIVAFSLSETYYADPDALETIGTLVEELHRSGREVFMLGFHAKVFEPLTQTHWFPELRQFTEYTALLQFLRDQVNAAGVYVPAAKLVASAHPEAAVPVAAAAVIAAPQGDIEAATLKKSEAEIAWEQAGAGLNVQGSTAAYASDEWK